MIRLRKLQIISIIVAGKILEGMKFLEIIILIIIKKSILKKGNRLRINRKENAEETLTTQLVKFVVIMIMKKVIGQVVVI